MIAKGSWYASIITKLIKRKGVGSSPTDRELDSSEDGSSSGPQATVAVKLPWVRRYHLECLSPWAEYECSKLEKIVPNRGRPMGSLSSLLSPEEKKHRQKLTRRRAYLICKVTTTSSPIEALVALEELTVDLRRELGPISYNPKINPTKSTRLQAIASRLQCPKGPGGRLCYLDAEYHCIYCSKCFRQSHGCIERKITL